LAERQRGETIAQRGPRPRISRAPTRSPVTWPTRRSTSPASSTARRSTTRSGRRPVRSRPGSTSKAPAPRSSGRARTSLRSAPPPTTGPPQCSTCSSRS
jgi:hypothetical protein